MRLAIVIAVAALMAACSPQGADEAIGTTVDKAAAPAAPDAPGRALETSSASSDTGVDRSTDATGSADPVLPVAMPAVPIGTGCAAEIGDGAAAVLVKRCLAVSPATRPPCHVGNACALIQSEIDRSCAQYGPDETRPPQCES